LKFIVSQIGAREHYAVARALHQAGRLDALYTDFWAGRAWRSFARVPGFSRLRSLAARSHAGLASAPVYSWNLAMLAWEYRLRQHTRTGDRYQGFIEVGQKFAGAVRDQLRRRRDWPAGTIFFSYDTGALETLEFLKTRGVPCVVDQMDPSRVEVDLVCAEAKRWPGWEPAAAPVPEAYFRRREQEWALADRVVVNSEFSRRALMQQGVPAEKLVVIPLCYEMHAEAEAVARPPRDPAAPLRVLFLGQVILRKGIQYLLAAAKLLESEPVHFDVVGVVGISADAVKSAPPNVTFHGRATRDQVRDWYQRADVFVLPTLSDGFALTQLEAMAYGLPVIATPNCGAVVTPGEDGLIVPPGDAAALAGALHRYLTEPKLLAEHQAGGRGKIRQFSLARLGASLAALPAGLVE